MNKYRSITLEGFQDRLFKESFYKRRLVERVRRIFESFGYMEIESPILEYYDVFENEFFDKENTFKLLDPKGRIVVLRPDLTIPIARIVASKLKNETPPIKIFYTGTIYRFQEAYGKSKEIYEAGIELIGNKQPDADAEAIVIAIEALKSTGLRTFQLEIGHAGIFNQIVQDANLKQEDIKELREIIDNKDLLGVQAFVQGKGLGKQHQELLYQLPSYFGEAKILARVKELCVDSTVLEPIQYLEKVIEILIARGYKKYISIDLGLVHHLNYYTGIIFKGFTHGVGYSVLNGGRYDQLINHFGADYPSIGFGMNMNEILSALDRQDNHVVIPNKRIYIGSKLEEKNTSFHFAQNLREKGFIVLEDMDNSNYETLISLIQEKDVKCLIYFEGDHRILAHHASKDQVVLSSREEMTLWVEGLEWNT